MKTSPIWFAMFGVLALAACSDESVQTTETAQLDAGAVSQEARGQEVYEGLCVGCHDGGVPKAPHKSMMQIMSPDSVVDALTTGVMQQEAADLSEAEKTAVAVYLTGKEPGGEQQYPPVACMGAAADFDRAKPAFHHSWGFDAGNTRTIPGDVAGLDKEDISKLTLKWAFAYPGASRARSQPTLAGGAIFVGSHNGYVYALDADSGCLRWSFRASAEVRTAVIVEPWSTEDAEANPAAFFGDLLGNVYAVEAFTGRLMWRHRSDDHASATITGSPSLHGGRLFVPVSSLEVTPAAHPDFACCTFRGSVVAYDAKTGKVEWQTFTIDEEPQVLGQTQVGTDQIGPSGAPIWNSPAIDVKRNQLYVGTGENYSSPATLTSDAIFAIDLDTGAVNWTFQATPNDAWNTACDTKTPYNCPVEDGPDFDFGAATMLATAKDGSDYVLGGQKSGMVHALNPDTGAVVWQTKAGRGGIQGGVHFGMGAHDGVVYVPVSDMPDGRTYPEPDRPGLYALDLKTGDYIWKAPATDTCGGREFCFPGISAAVTVIPGIVFAGAMDGHLRAYDSASGEVLWDIDTLREYETLSGEVARGGALGGANGPIVADGVIYANSGYGIYAHMPGNVLLVFGVEGD